MYPQGGSAHSMPVLGNAATPPSGSFEKRSGKSIPGRTRRPSQSTKRRDHRKWQANPIRKRSRCWQQPLFHRLRRTCLCEPMLAVSIFDLLRRSGTNVTGSITPSKDNVLSPPSHRVTGSVGIASIPAASSIRRNTAEKSFSLLSDNSSAFT